MINFSILTSLCLSLSLTSYLHLHPLAVHFLSPTWQKFHSSDETKFSFIPDSCIQPSDIVWMSKSHLISKVLLFQFWAFSTGLPLTENERIVYTVTKNIYMDAIMKTFSHTPSTTTEQNPFAFISRGETHLLSTIPTAINIAHLSPSIWW